MIMLSMIVVCGVIRKELLLYRRNGLCVGIFFVFLKFWFIDVVDGIKINLEMSIKLSVK